LVSGVRLNLIDWKIASRDGRQSQPVMLVDDAITLTDGTREIKFYHVPNSHTSGCWWALCATRECQEFCV
jgi:hypothetical protein